MIHRNSVPRNSYMNAASMRQYIQQLISGSEQWKAIKMVVLGNGRVGKTTLLRAFDGVLHPNQISKVCISPHVSLAN